jgi:hypothetical protein
VEHVRDPPQRVGLAEVRLELSVSRTRLVTQESPPVTLIIHNDGVEAALAPNPETNGLLPLLRVRGPGPGEVLEHEPRLVLAARGRRLAPASEQQPASVLLAPGAEVRLEFDLLERLVLPGPGRYEVEALLRAPLDPTAPPPAEVASAPVALEVVALDPCWVATAHGHGGFDDAAWLALVQRATEAEPAAVHVRSFEVFRGRVLPRLSFRAGDAPVDARPLVSTSPQGEAPEGARLVAWVASDALCWVEFGERAPPAGAEPARVRIGSGAQLLGPPVVEPALPDRPARTRAFVRGPDDAARAVALTPGAPDEVTISLPGVWSHVVAPGRGGPRVLAIAAGPEGVELSAVTWDAAPRRAVRLGAWKGELAASAAVVDAEDIVLGTILTWFRKRPTDAPSLIAVRWRLDPESGRFEAQTPRLCAWDRRLGTPPITLRLDGQGEPHALFQDDQGRWLLAASGNVPRPLFPEPDEVLTRADASPQAIGPIELMFFDGGAAPYVLVHEARDGLRVISLGGSGVPDVGSPEMAQPELEER